MVDEWLTRGKSLLVVIGKLFKIYFATSAGFGYYAMAQHLGTHHDHAMIISLLIGAFFYLAVCEALDEYIYGKPESKYYHRVIYLLRREDGIYKIGYTNDIRTRTLAHVRDYGMDFRLIKIWRVNDMTTAEDEALRLTRRYHHVEGNRQELRKMNLIQVVVFMVVFSWWLGRAR